MSQQKDGAFGRYKPEGSKYLFFVYILIYLGLRTLTHPPTQPQTHAHTQGTPDAGMGVPTHGRFAGG
jgi:hypothetical protein